MYIRKIYINNITSLKGKHVIDFTQPPLSSASLFAITGDTGAGKSTILDAICLALYNKVPRMSIKQNGSKGDNGLSNSDTRNLLRRGEENGSCGVEFSTAEGIFLAEWSVRVKRTGTIDNVKRSLKQLEPKKHDFNLSSLETDSEISRIVGLDYEQFTRTVILAQNSFSNFLRAKYDEKAQLLEKITGTGIYSIISQVVFEKAAEARNDYEKLQTSYDAYKQNVLDETLLGEYNSRKNLAESQRKGYEQSIARCNKQLDWYDKYDELDKKVNAATEAFNAANNESIRLTPDRDRLQRYDDVAGIRDKVVSVEFHDESIAKANKEIERLRAEEKDKAALKAQADKARDEAHDNFTKAANTLAQKEPLFGKCHDIKREIGSLETQLDENGKELLQNQNRASDLAKMTEENDQKTNALREKAETCNNALQELSPHQNMLDNFGSVIEKIRSYASCMREAADMNNKKRELTAGTDNLAKALGELDKDIDKASQRKKSLEESLMQYANSTLGMDQDELQKIYNSSLRKNVKLQSAKTLWENISHDFEKKNSLDENITSLSITVESQKSQIKQLTKKTEALKEELEKKEKSLEDINIVIGELQSNLKEGEPCPVCGSTHHPLSEVAEQRMNELANSTDKERYEAKELYNSSLNDLNEMKAKQSADVANLGTFNDSRDEIEKQLAKYAEEWKQYEELDRSFADCSPNVNAEARATTIAQLLDNSSKTLEQADRQLKEYNRFRELIDNCNKEISEVSEKLSALKDKRTDIISKKSSAEGNIDTINDTLNGNSAKAHSIYSDLEKLVTVADWRQLIDSEPAKLTEEISILWKSYNDNTAQLQKIEESLSAADTDRKLLNDKTQKTSEDIQKLTDKANALKGNINDRQRDIRKMFGEENPEEAEAETRKQAENARKDFEEKNRLAGEAGETLGKIEATLANAENNCKTLEAERLEISTDIDKWISAFNHNHAQSNSSVNFDELTKIFKSEENWNALREKLNKAEETFKLADDRLKTAQTELNNWQSRPEHPDRATETRQAISLNIENINKKKDEAERELQDINTKLTIHDDNLAKAKELKPKLKEFEDVARDWGKLNDMIGSSNGQKFSKIAQNFTLKLLVEHANAQLALFSPRYRLEKVEGNLDLEITDRYMNDGRRPVSSLSGGETFVVSLGLALGLASLSSRKLSIESLFIDEGFGNLDKESLDLVIHALGNLNAQGRKVGIISHTQQIRENIFPQIQVRRNNSKDSFSDISVVSF